MLPSCQTMASTQKGSSDRVWGGDADLPRNVPTAKGEGTMTKQKTPSMLFASLQLRIGKDNC